MDRFTQAIQVILAESAQVAHAAAEAVQHDSQSKALAAAAHLADKAFMAGDLTDASYYLGIADAMRFLLGEPTFQEDNPRLYEVAIAYVKLGGHSLIAHKPHTAPGEQS